MELSLIRFANGQEISVASVKEKYDLLKDIKSEALLEVLNSDFIETGSLLHTYIALAVVSVGMDGQRGSVSKPLDFTLGLKTLEVLEGEWMSGGLGRINEITTKGFIFNKNYRPDLQRKPAYDLWKREEGLMEKDGGLFMNIKPHERWIKLSTNVLTNTRRLRVEHVATFTNLQIPETRNRMRGIYGPRVLVREGEQNSLFTSDYEKGKWLKLLDILREPKIEKVIEELPRRSVRVGWNESLIF